jgi:molecular chaperone DnaJ
MSKKDYYESLGLTKSASKQDIKKAYRKLAKEYHPDKNKSAGAESRFKEIQEAYDVLSDDQKRKAYDQYGFAGTQAFGNNGGLGGGFHGGTSFSGDFGDLGDVLGNFFGGSFGGFDFGDGSSRRSSSSAGQRGNDLEMSLKVDFLEAVFGVEKEVVYKREVSCSLCKGSGAKDGRKKTCSTCGGNGQVRKVQNTFFGAMQVLATCPDCAGVGQVIEVKCSKCRGGGTESVQEHFKIQIPSGIPDGVTIRFTGRGSAGKYGGAKGDLYITIEVKPHKVLERRGDDIYMDKVIDVIDAVLGAEVAVPTVHGDVIMKVPAGTQSGKVLRLKEKGGPRFKGSGNGDQYVKLIVEVPSKLSKEQRHAWEELRSLK